MTPQYEDAANQLAQTLAKSDNPKDILVAKAILTALGAIHADQVSMDALADALTAFSAGQMEKRNNYDR